MNNDVYLEILYEILERAQDRTQKEFKNREIEYGYMAATKDLEHDLKQIIDIVEKTIYNIEDE